MWNLTACKISVSLLFLNWIKNEMIFYRTCISQLILATLIQRYDKKKKQKKKKQKQKKHFIFYPVQKRATN